MTLWFSKVFIWVFYPLINGGRLKGDRKQEGDREQHVTEDLSNIVFGI